MSNWPRGFRPSIRHKERVFRTQEDVARTIGIVPEPNIPGIVESPMNLPGETETIPPIINVQNPEAHLPPVTMPAFVQAMLRDFIGALKANSSAGSRIWPRDNQPTATVANSSVEILFFFPLRHVVVQNNSTTAITVDIGRPANIGSLAVSAGSLLSIDAETRSVSIWSTVVTPINDGVSTGIYLAGYE
jgi:hypothetical protein